MAESQNLDYSVDKYGEDDVAVAEVPHSNSSEGNALHERLETELNHRKLGSRQLQLTSIAGSIGAMLFVSIGAGIASGGVCLFVAYLFWVTVVFGIAQCQLEIVTMFPLDGSFIRLAARMVDPALGVAAGWNHFFAQASYVIFEATIINTLVEYWGYDKSPAILISVSLAFYFLLNIWRADVFGEVEFWIALGKVLLAVGLMFYTLVTMCGGNPMGDKFGFRNWKDTPWVGTDSSSQFQSFLNAVIIATFTMGGPEYISMLAGEAQQPRKTIKRAFKTIMARLVLFNIIGAVSITILVPVNDPTLTNGSDTYAGGSPYIISMKNLGIKVLPSIVTAALLTTIISAGNAYTFGASRSLHAMALDGSAPKFLRKTNRNGVPYVAVCCVGALSLLAYLALGSTSATVLSWITSFCTAATLFNWCVMSFTYIRFHRAMKAQGIDKKQYLPATSRWTPWIAYWSFGWSFLWLWVQGYGVFLNGKWKVATFIFNYGIIALAGAIGIGYKIFAKTKFRRAKDVDLVSDVEFFQLLDDHYKQEKEIKPDTKVQRIIDKVF